MPFAKSAGLPISKKPGVYAIVNTVNGKAYVGSSLCMRGRLLAHRSCLRRGVHENEYLKRAWNKYGEKAFRFDGLKSCPPDLLIETEQYWINFLRVLDSRK